MVAFKTSYGVIQQSLFYSPVYSEPDVGLHADQPAAGPRARAVLHLLIVRVASWRDRRAESSQPVRRRPFSSPSPQGSAARCACRRRPPSTPCDRAAAACRCATASSCSPTTTYRDRRRRRAPCWSAARTAAAFRSPRCSAASTRRAAITCVPERARHVRLGRRVRPDGRTRSTTAPTPSPGCASSRGSPASFATVGLSYLGFTQWALLTDPPPEMKAAVITVGPHDFSGPRWGTGSFGLNDFLGWSDLVVPPGGPAAVAHAAAPGYGRSGWSTQGVAGPAARRGRPRRCSATARRGTSPGCEHPEPDDPFWAAAAAATTRWTAPRSRCCCSPAGRTCSSTRPSSSTARCAAAA